MDRRVVVIIPAYNEELSIAGVVKSVRELRQGYDVVVVNDDSKDNTGQKAIEEGARVIELPFNLGIGAAVQTGFKYAVARGCDACVQVDGDGQHPATGIPTLLHLLFDEDLDIVIGSRFVADTKYRVSFMRGLGIKMLSMFLRVATGMRIKDPTSGFRAINKRTMELFAREYPQDYPEPESLLVARQHRLRVREVPIEMKERMYGASSITTIRSAYYMVKVLLAMFIDLFKQP